MRPEIEAMLARLAIGDEDYVELIKAVRQQGGLMNLNKIQRYRQLGALKRARRILRDLRFGSSEYEQLVSELRLELEIAQVRVADLGIDEEYLTELSGSGYQRQLRVAEARKILASLREPRSDRRMVFSRGLNQRGEIVGLPADWFDSKVERLEEICQELHVSLEDLGSSEEELGRLHQELS